MRTPTLAVAAYLAAMPPALAVKCGDPGVRNAVKAARVVARGVVTEVRREAPGGERPWSGLLRVLGFSREGTVVTATVKDLVVYKGDLGEAVTLKSVISDNTDMGGDVATGPVLFVGRRDGDGVLWESSRVCRPLQWELRPFEEAGWTAKAIPAARLLAGDWTRSTRWEILENARLALVAPLTALRKEPGDAAALKTAQAILQTIEDSEREAALLRAYVGARPGDASAAQRLRYLDCRQKQGTSLNENACRA